VIALVVAHSANRVIGKQGELPWHLPGDLARFKEITSGGTVVMGRKTYESIPEKFRPLPGRRNIVLSRNGFEAAGVDVRRDLQSALAEDCFVIGGDTVYAQALPLADRLYVTEVQAEVDGDAFFPELPAGRWLCTEQGERREENGLPYVFRVYDRAN
jgi:dihydrofolate reductase